MFGTASEILGVLDQGQKSLKRNMLFRKAGNIASFWLRDYSICRRLLPNRRNHPDDQLLERRRIEYDLFLMVEKFTYWTSSVKGLVL